MTTSWGLGTTAQNTAIPVNRISAATMIRTGDNWNTRSGVRPGSSGPARIQIVAETPPATNAGHTNASANQMPVARSSSVMPKVTNATASVWRPSNSCSSTTSPGSGLRDTAQAMP